MFTKTLFLTPPLLQFNTELTILISPGKDVAVNVLKILKEVLNVSNRYYNHDFDVMGRRKCVRVREAL